MTDGFAYPTRTDRSGNDRRSASHHRNDPAAIEAIGLGRIRRRDRLGGLLHEYELAA